MTLKKIVRTLGLSALLGFVATPVCAQDLIARQSPVDRRAKALDTIVINRLQESEEIENPASMLYSDWSTSKTHAQGYLPDVYKIDLRGFHMPTQAELLPATTVAVGDVFTKVLTLKYISATPYEQLSQARFVS